MLRIIVIALIASLFAVTSAFGFWTVRCEKFINETRITAEVTIPKTGGFNVMYNEVFRPLDTPFFFKYYLTRVKDIDKNLKYGYYKVTDTTVKDFLDMMTKGAQSTMKITFPEGYNTFDMAQRLDNFIVDDAGQFFRLTRDPEFIYKLTGMNLNSLEGYLYPNTYNFPPFSRPNFVIQTMYWLFTQQLPKNAEARAAELGMTLNEIIILASIIQKETFDPSEAPVISSVYHNRLKKKMRLQADPTVIYGLLPEFDGNLTKKHLQDDTNPYNTYKRKGLPPTPICNPSKMAIEAALYPADTRYLYFVADKNHVHSFSENYNDQINNVNKFQKNQ
ncbi:MAG: endolytic transglycosylase MltG [Deferribacterales bacterium]